MLSKLFIGTLMLAFSTLSLFTCSKTTNTPTSSTPQGKPIVIIKYDKMVLRCGTCKDYKIDILSNQRANYTGEANMPVLGLRNIDIKQATFKEIKTAFESSDFTKFEKRYMGRLPDLPVSVITYNNHRVQYQEDACPPKLKALVKLVEKLIPEK